MGSLWRNKRCWCSGRWCEYLFGALKLISLMLFYCFMLCKALSTSRSSDCAQQRLVLPGREAGAGGGDGL